MYQQIIHEIKNGVSYITLNRPDFGNALSETMQQEMCDVINKADKDEEVRAVVITGAGKNFCAGGDIKSFREMLDRGEGLDAEHLAEFGSSTVGAMRKCSKPIIAIVNGAAAGAGCSIALAADFRVVDAKSSFIMAFVNMGLCGDTGGYFSLLRLVGAGRAAEMMATGERIYGEKAYEWGIANIVAGDGELMSEGIGFAEKLAKMPTLAIGFQKKLVDEFYCREIKNFTAREGEYMNICSRSEDFEEAVNSFIEKRTPNFKGK